MHFDFSDHPLIIPDNRRAVNGGISSAQQSHKISSELFLSFFEINLKNDDAIVDEKLINQLGKVNF